MSLPHVLATAKKLGIPVVITNERGEASQVVMPFDDFAAMVGSSSPVPRRTPHMSAPIPTHDPFKDEIEEALSEIQFEGIREKPFMKDSAPAAPDRDASAGLDDLTGDKFYLEPIDDEAEIK